MAEEKKNVETLEGQGMMSRMNRLSPKKSTPMRK